MFIWPDESAPDGATWTGSFNQAEWDEYLASREDESDTPPAKKTASGRPAKKATTTKKEE